MQHLRHRSWRRLSSLVFVALLLVPIAFSGHRHANEVARASSCATCLVVHHQPAASAPGVAHVVPVFVALRLPGTRPAALPTNAQPIALGRAPPASSTALPA